MSGTSGIVVFDWLNWSAQYPEFGSVGSGQAQGYFNQACLYLDNTASSPITDASQPGGKRETILYLLTSHITAMSATINGVAPNALVGRITNASQGSVSVAAEMPAPMSAAWFNQTRYGAMAWAAMAPYRLGLYAAAPRIPRAAQSYPGFIGFR